MRNSPTETKAMKLGRGAVFLFSILLGMSTHAGDRSIVKIVDIDRAKLDAAELTALSDLPFMKITDGENPSAGVTEDFKSEDGKFIVEQAAYSELSLTIVSTAEAWPVDEFMYILEGQVEITNLDGTSKVYGPGDAFVMPRGFRGTWRQLSPLKKIAVSYSAGAE
jgi:uncharacterized cupin superfamily protein